MLPWQGSGQRPEKLCCYKVGRYPEKEESKKIRRGALSLKLSSP
jgi:hypothetical protein